MLKRLKKTGQAQIVAMVFLLYLSGFIVVFSRRMALNY